MVYAKLNIHRPRPVGTNLILVRRVMAKNLLSMKAERAKRAERLMAWGPGARSRAPGGVQGQSPGGGPGGSALGSSWVLASVKCPERLSWKYFFFNQPTILSFCIRRATSVPLGKGTKIRIASRETVDTQAPRNTNFTH